uniref:Uncharacterized protein n=1 Tax=Candidatus Kentrum sp. UNK TaxID=2126344 RepID=A0A451B489_9GAMM|nr:MAG: hypothetical protein BECKUNK1418G_GA0071005_116210 [Candidatus Kentron sp. UNK]VFK73108.1 MAG: hypothetical protein BECKUNK1418H_GA0071006_116310 [Candidatus Kentron sp. UNK]
MCVMKFWFRLGWVRPHYPPDQGKSHQNNQLPVGGTPGGVARNNTWARKGRVGKWGESTPSRQRGGSGASLSLTQYMFFSQRTLCLSIFYSWL